MRHGLDKDLPELRNAFLHAFRISKARVVIIYNAVAYTPHVSIEEDYEDVVAYGKAIADYTETEGGVQDFYLNWDIFMRLDHILSKVNVFMGDDEFLNLWIQGLIDQYKVHGTEKYLDFDLAVGD